MAISSGDSVVIEYTGRLDDGTVFDTSREEVAEESGLADDQPDREYGPMTVEVGSGRIIEGLEDALLGLEEGDTKTVTVSPDEAYGEPRDDQVMEYDPPEFRQMLEGANPEVGMHVQSQEGALGEIVRADDETVRVDFNHVLAGEALTFDVEIVSVD